MIVFIIIFFDIKEIKKVTMRITISDNSFTVLNDVYYFRDIKSIRIRSSTKFIVLKKHNLNVIRKDDTGVEYSIKLKDLSDTKSKISMIRSILKFI